MRDVSQAGQALVGLLQALAALALLLTATVAWQPAVRGRSVESCARALAARCRVLAVQAVTDGSARALVFSSGAAAEPLREARDGDADGISRADMATGMDRTGPPFTLARDFPGVRVGLLPWTDVPDLPPATRLLDPAESPVRFGAERLAVFDPDAHATPGTLFVTDGDTAVCAIVVNGATARVRTLCLDRTAGEWRQR